MVQRLATDQALAEARQLTEVSARVVQARVDDGLLTGDAESLGSIAAVVVNAVLHDPVVRVKIWTADGEIVYADVPELIGKRYPLGPDDAEVVEHGGVEAELSDLSAPENRFEARFGELLEVYTRIETPDGTPLLFETYQLASSIERPPARTARDLRAGAWARPWSRSPCSWCRSPGSSRDGCAPRSASASVMMERMLDASDRERRRIAGDLHDGPVQELAGLSMRLSAVGRGDRRPVGSRGACVTPLRRCGAACARCGRRSWASIRRTCSRRVWRRRSSDLVAGLERLRRRRHAGPRRRRCVRA